MVANDFRVMIVDADQSQRLFIERTLNGLGYFSVLGFGSMREASSILSLTHITFDLLMVNSLEVLEEGFDSNAFCNSRPIVRNAVFYGNFVPLFSQPSTYSDLFSNGIISPYSIKMNTLRSLMLELDGSVARDGSNFKYIGRSR